MVLRFIVQAVRAHGAEDLALRSFGQELVARLHQLRVADTAAVLKEHVEAGGVTQFKHRWRGEGEHHRIAEGEEVLLGALGQGEHAVFLRAFIPGFEHDEGHA